MTCPYCGASNWKITDDNGASYPETRVEFCECLQCGTEFKNVLTA